MEQSELNKILENHKKWLNNKGGERADLREADLREADLQKANLRGANLRGADLDFSCLPLWCGSKGMKTDLKIIYQLLAHVVVLDCNEPVFTEIKEKILPYAMKSHRASDLGLK